MKNARKTQIWAHRGSAFDRAENSMAAFERAYEIGADGIELDVHLSKDGVPVVIHDETFDRTSLRKHVGRVQDFLWSEMQTYNLPFTFTDQVYHPVSLEEVLLRFKDTPLLINIELKTDIIDYPEICQKVLALCEKTAFPKRRLWFSSFNPKSLRELYALDAELQMGFLFSKRLKNPGQIAQSCHARALHPHYALLFLPFYLNRLRKKLAMHSWTVDHPFFIRLLLWRKIDAIITNNPALALKIRDKR